VAVEEIEVEKLRRSKFRETKIMQDRPPGRRRQIRHFRDLDVYQRSLALAMKIFEMTKAFPVDEKYSLVDQIRRSSRSICSNIAEAWRKGNTQRYSEIN